ncbi:MAG TPA: sugar kinase [Ilumatobacter sp.]|nr:sugar kinase [Ilumatobacter sp.]
MSDRFDLCALGDYCWDVVISTPDELRRGGDSLGSVELHAGGSAANTAVWAARCGAAVAFVGMVGDDLLGRIAADDLAREGVRAHLPTSAERPTGAVASFVDHAGERSMVTGVGADHLLTPADVPAELVTAARHLHLTGWSLFGDPPRAAALAGAQLAAEAGMTISLDPSAHQMIDTMGVDEFLAMTVPLRPRVLFPNRDEGRVLTGEHEPEAIAAALAEMYPGAVVVLKLDADGALVAGARVPAPQVAVVDTTGAGDSFAGAFLAHWLAGADPVAAAQTAVEVAAWVVQHVGSRPPTRPA